MTLTILWIGIIVIVTIVFIMMVQKPKLRKTSQREIIESGKRNLFTIQIGDIICYNDEEWGVEQKIIYNASGYHWYEYMLLNGDEICWLSVEQDDLIEVAWMKPTKKIDITSTPPRTLNIEGDKYKCVESGKATISKEAQNQENPWDSCTY